MSRCFSWQAEVYLCMVGRQDFREVLAQLMGPCLASDFLTNGKKGGRIYK